MDVSKTNDWWFTRETLMFLFPYFLRSFFVMKIDISSVPKDVSESHKNVPLAQKRTSNLDTEQQDNQLYRTFLWDTGKFF